MEIFGIGPGEMMIILVLALIIVGPQKLPEMGRNLGRTLGEFKAQTDQLRSVMTFDPVAPAAPATPAPAMAARDPQLVLHSDDRVLAMQAYSHAAPGPAPDTDTLVFVPALTAEQERAS
ncbi:MAG TPA: twin-arginine translocase TatA/TatE family subunit [Chloroflexia bacterium]|nr:twin-arginine translocase TatA/TatE family subunit [Chloroflexia bacterium]